MTPDAVFDFGAKLGRLFKLFGELKFLRRLRDFLQHGGKRSRVEFLTDASKAFLEIEKAEAQRIQNRRAILELMRDADLPEEEVQAKMRDAIAIEGVQAALETLLRYVENGNASVRLVSPHEPPPPTPLAVALRTAALSTGPTSSSAFKLFDQIPRSRRQNKSKKRAKRK